MENAVQIIDVKDLCESTPDSGQAVTEAYRTAATSKGAMDSRVSRQWASRPDDEKYTDLQTLHDSVLARSQSSRSNLIDPSKIKVNVTGETISLQSDDMPEVNMTNWAMSQLCSMTKTPADYLRRLPDQIAAINLQTGLMAYEGDAMQAYTGSDMLRAMTGKNYGRIHDHEVVAQVRKIAGNGTGDTRWKVPGQIDWSSHKDGMVLYNPFVDITKENTTLYASDRDVYIFLVDDTHPIEVGKLPSGEPDLMFRGFIVWNSEVGSKSFGMSTMLLRGVCCNRNLWGVEKGTEIRMRHSRLAPDRFAIEAEPMLKSYADTDTAGIVSKVRNAKLAIVAKTDEERVDFLMDKVGLSKPLSERVLESVLNEEQKKAESIWDMVQGITATARKIQHQDARIELERKGSKLMDKIAA